MLRGNRKQFDDEDVKYIHFKAQEKQESLKEILSQLENDNDKDYYEEPK